MYSIFELGKSDDMTAIFLKMTVFQLSAHSDMHE